MTQSPTKRIAFGIGLGLLFGFLGDDFLLIYTSIWLATYVIPVVLLPLSGGIIGGVVGWKLRIPSPPWPAIAAIVVLYPIAVWCPIKIQEVKFRRFAEDLPVFPESERQVKSVLALGGDSPPSVRVEFRANANAEEMVRFYRRYLIEHDWQPISAEQDAREWQSFRKDYYTITLIGFDSDQAGEHNEFDSVAVVRSFNNFFYRSQR